VSLTPAGRVVVARVHAVTEHAPPAFATLPPAELAALERVIKQITR
jgi:hypothetical protein